MRKKSLAIFIIGIFALIILNFVTYSPVILQENNLMVVSRSIVKLKLSNEKIVLMDSERYITETKGSDDTIISFMKDKGGSFKEQVGAGFIFEKQGNSLIVVSRQYSKYFRVWTIPNIE